MRGRVPPSLCLLLSALAVLFSFPLSLAIPSAGTGHQIFRATTKDLAKPTQQLWLREHLRSQLPQCCSGRLRGGNDDVAEAGSSVRPVLQVAIALYDGIRSFVLGVALALKYLLSSAFFSDPQLVKKLMFTPVLLLSVYAIAFLLRLSVWPIIWVLKKLGCDMEPGQDIFVQFAAIVFLVLIREFPQLASDCSLFFDTLHAKDPALAAELKERPIIHTLGKKLRKWAACAFFVVVFALAAVVLLPMAAPFVAAGVAAAAALIAAAGPVALVCGAVAVVVIGVFGAGFSSVCLPFLKLYSFDPVLSLLALALVLGGLTSARRLGELLAAAAKLYVAALLLTHQLLAEYWERLPSSAWDAFQHHHAWTLLGFGLPICGIATRLHPMAFVASLQLLQLERSSGRGARSLEAPAPPEQKRRAPPPASPEGHVLAT